MYNVGDRLILVSPSSKEYVYVVSEVKGDVVKIRQWSLGSLGIEYPMTELHQQCVKEVIPNKDSRV